MGNEDIIVYGSDEHAELGQEDEAEIEKFRDERLRRVHTYAHRYLAGDRVYIHCARLKGPVINNPWKRKEPETADRGKRKEYSDHKMMPPGVREFKRRRLMDEDEEDEVMATPTQRARTMGIEIVGKSACQKPGPKRKRAAPKKVVHEGGWNGEEEKGEDQVEEELNTISVASGVQAKLNTITAAAIGPGWRKTTTTGKSNSRTTEVCTSKTKPKPSTATSKNSSKASATAAASKETGATSRRWKVEPLQEKVTEETTVTVKSTTRGRGEGCGGQRGRVSAKPKAPVTQHAEDEGEVSGASSIRRSQRRAPAKAKWGDHVSLTVSGETISKAKQAQPETADLESQPDYAMEPAMEQPLEATAAAATTNFWEGPVEPLANPRIEPITPVANLSLEEPTPPSIFYGPSGASKNDVTGNVNLANKFIAIRRGASDPAVKQSSSKSRAILATGTKPKRTGSVLAAVAKKAGKKTTGGTAAVGAASGKRKQKVTVASLEREGDSREHQGGGDYDWIPESSDFRYKKGNGKKTAAVGAKDNVLADDGKAGKEESINKGKGQAKEATPAQQPKRKKPRVIDFAALSPFGGGHVVTKDGRVYSRSRGDHEGEGKGTDKPRVDRHNTLRPLQPENKVSVAATAPSSLNTPFGKPMSCEKDDSSLQKILSNTNSQGNIYQPPVAVNQKAAAAKKSTQVAPAVSQPSQARGLITLGKAVDQAGPATECTMSTVIHSEAPPVSTLSTSREPRSTEPTTHVEELTFAVPPPPTAGLESQSPWMNTQRQLSAARKVFMSLLDTPNVEESTPVKIPSATLSRLRRGPDFSLKRGAGTMKTSPGNSLSTTPPGSIVLMPEAPASILAGLNPDPAVPAVEDEVSSGAGVVPGTSPSGPTTSRYHQALGESTTTPAALSAFRTRNGADVTFSSRMAVRGDVSGDGHGEGAIQSESIRGIPPPEFLSFKTFDTPTKSQFGSFMQEFSPLRYSPDEVLGMVEGSQSQPMPQPRSQPKSSTVPIRLFGRDRPKDSSSPTDKSENQQRVNPSAWLGFSQSRTSNISLFNSSASALVQRPAPPSSPALQSPLPSHSPQAHTSPPVPPTPLFPSSQEQAPSTPRFRRTSSIQFAQNGQQSPGTALAGDMLEMMGGGVWDIDEELNKMRTEDTQAVEAEGLRKTLATPATARGKLGKGLFSSGTRRVGSGKRRW